jgi:outer membrane protein OmpA-like peptidoglycan-associated protein
VVETSVHFAFNRDNLTGKARSALDELGSEIPKTKNYIITVEGGADGVGSQQYNYGLSDRRADSVIQYLASKYNVPAHKIYLIGLGKDKPVATNKTAAGRAKNRRVDIRLMTNTEGQQQQQQAPSSTGPAASLVQPQGK